MSMRVFSGILLVLILGSCKKKIQEQVVYDNVIYEIDDVVVYGSALDKTKQKTPTQFISILYADLFQEGISSDELTDLSELYVSIGDKTMANELILSHYLEQPTVQLPTDQEMRADVSAFVQDCYIRFMGRLPSSYEKLYWVSAIEEDLTVTPELVYTAFVLSNEYYFY